MGWNSKDAWPEPNKLVVRRRVKEIQQQTKTVEQQVEARTKKIKQLRRRIAELEREEKMSTQAIPDVNETFSRLCSDMLTIMQEECGSGRAWPTPDGVCWPDRRFRLRVIGRLARSGYTLRRFVIELKQRTSERWVRFGPFGLLEQFAECLEV